VLFGDQAQITADSRGFGETVELFEIELSNLALRDMQIAGESRNRVSMLTDYHCHFSNFNCHDPLPNPSPTQTNKVRPPGH
jgi:hypothetical protein